MLRKIRALCSPNCFTYELIGSNHGNGFFGTQDDRLKGLPRSLVILLGNPKSGRLTKVVVKRLHKIFANNPVLNPTDLFDVNEY